MSELDSLAQIIERFNSIEAAQTELLATTRLQRARTMVLVNSLIARVDSYQKAFGVFSADELRDIINREDGKDE